MTSDPKEDWTLWHWSPRARLYGSALVAALVYLLVGRLSSDNLQWVQVYLPLSAASVLLLCAAATESYFLIRRLQKRHAELIELRAREQELAQRVSIQRQSLLNQISRALLDKLDLRQLPAEVLEKTALLFETDVAGVWTIDSNHGAVLSLKGVSGLDAGPAKQLGGITQATPCFDKILAHGKPTFVQDFHVETAPALAAFCEAEKLVAAALGPIICHGKLAGLLGVFYRQKPNFTPALSAELQTVANVIAGAIQAEELYRDLIQIQKVDSLGSLASGIAHDFNNVLAAVLASASYVKQQTPTGTDAHRYLDAIETSAHRGAALTKQLLSFVRRERPRVSVLNVNHFVEQTLTMLERSFDKTIVIHRRFADNLSPVEMDPSQLEQIVLNIAVNARDAMPNGGTFTVMTRNVTLDALDAHRPAVSLADGDYVALSFRDTGCGMDDATLKRIFEPFFTTKGGGHGTGLGLSVVQSVVRSFGGEIRAAASPGKGALFEVYLPSTTKPLPATLAAPTTKVRGGHETLLLVEDEDIIREMAQLELEARGYKVLTATDGAAALERYQQEWQQIDLAIVDMVMPRLSGPELFARMKEINPNVRVVVSSGYSHDLEGQRMLEHGCLGFLQKPYDAETLARTIRAILDSGL